MTKKIADIHITGICNLNCEFCDGADKKYSGPTFQNYIKTLGKLHQADVNTVVLTGGEPLMRDDIVDIVNETYRQDFQVYLSTNGIRLMKHYDKIRDKIACLGIPIDGSTIDMHINMSRGPRVFPAVKNILQYFSEHPPNHIVKVGTVVSAVNKDDIVNIGKFLYEDNDFKVDVWRLYQFSPLKEGFKNKDKYMISEDEFNNICCLVKKRFPGKNIVPLSDAESNDAYIFINPNLELEVLSGGKFSTLGNILEMPQSELNEILKSQDKTIIRSNINRGWLIDGT